MTTSYRRIMIAVLATGVLTFGAGAALAFSSGPQDGLTNAPGESNCTNCHSSFPLNSGSGSFALDGLPTSYVPGEVYDLTLTLSDPDAMRWGFELTIIEDGDASAVSVGEITATDAGTQLSSSGDRDYLKHNSGGTAPGTSGSKSWVLQWTAPQAGTGDVRLYVAGNAANNNGGTSGDRIYATSFGSAEDTGVPVGDLPQTFALQGAWPNPFNPRTEIRFELPAAAHVRTNVFTMDGRRVATLADRQFGQGSHGVTWDGRDHAGQRMGSGTYLFVVEAGGERQVGRMTLIK
jgi:hypothetical protein